MSEKLLPCPFCGGEAHLFNPDKFKNVTVRCNVCGAQTAPILDHEGASIKAFEAWNCRAAPETTASTGSAT